MYIRARFKNGTTVSKIIEGTTIESRVLDDFLDVECKGELVKIETDAERFGDNCLFDRDLVSSVTAPSLKEIGNDCFRGCYSLKTFKADKLTKIGYSCFIKCNLSNGIYTPLIEEIKDHSFLGSSLASFDSIHLNEVGDNCFSYCLSLKYVNIPFAKKGTDCF